jgi:hypothetical protein
LADFLERPGLSDPKLAQQFANQKGLRVSKRSDVEDNSQVTLFRHGAAPKPVYLSVDDRLGLGRVRGQPAECIRDLRIELLGQVGKQFMTQPIARKRTVSVGAVLAELLSDSSEELDDVRSAQRKEWSDQDNAGSQASRGRDSRETSQTCTADDPVQDRLSLIVGGMGRRHKLHPNFAGGFGEEILAEFACRCLDAFFSFRRMERHDEPPASQRDLESLAQLTHEPLIRVALLAAQGVVRMHGGEVELFLATQRIQRNEQGRAVRAAGNGGDDALSNHTE